MELVGLPIPCMCYPASLPPAPPHPTFVSAFLATLKSCFTWYGCTDFVAVAAANVYAGWILAFYNQIFSITHNKLLKILIKMFQLTVSFQFFIFNNISKIQATIHILQFIT